MKHMVSVAASLGGWVMKQEKKGVEKDGGLGKMCDKREQSFG